MPLMAGEYITNSTFEKTDYTKLPFAKGEYEDCAFKECNFASTNLSEIAFVECTFENCDLSNAKLNTTALKDVAFENCKILGVDFSVCNPFLLELKFTDCQLNFASFYKLKLKGIVFTNCSLQEVDFVESELNNGVFDNCNLLDAVFERSLLEKADFRTAYNYSFDPDINRIKGAKFSKEEVIGLLAKYAIIIK